MDDCVLIYHDKMYLRNCLEKMWKHIEDERLLKFNQKTEIVPISQGIDYLGFRFFLTETGKVIRRLRNSNKKRMKRKLKFFSRAYASGDIELAAMTRSLASYRGHLSHGHTYRLQKNLLNNLVLRKQNK